MRKETSSDDRKIEDLEPWLRSLAAELVGDANEADDLVQSTWVEAMAADRPHMSRGWLRGVMTNVARARWRKRAALTDRRFDSKRLQLEKTIQQPFNHESPGVALDLRNAVDALEEPFHTLILQHFFEGLSLAEIARRTEQPSATVRWRKNRAIELLKLELDRTTGTDRQSWLGALALMAGGDVLKVTRRNAGGLGFGAIAASAVIAALVVMGTVLLWGGRSPSGEGPLRDIAAVDPQADQEDLALATMSVGEREAAPQQGTGPTTKTAAASGPSAEVRVVGAATQEPIEGAIVEVVTKDGAFARGTTDSDGIAQVTYTAEECDGAGYVAAQGRISFQARHGLHGPSHLYQAHVPTEANDSRYRSGRPMSGTQRLSPGSPCALSSSSWMGPPSLTRTSSLPRRRRVCSGLAKRRPLPTARSRCMTIQPASIPCRSLCFLAWIIQARTGVIVPLLMSGGLVPSTTPHVLRTTAIKDVTAAGHILLPDGSGAGDATLVVQRRGVQGITERQSIASDGAFSFKSERNLYDLVVEVEGQGQVTVGALDLRYGSVLDFQYVLPHKVLLSVEALPPGIAIDMTHDYALTSINDTTGVGVLVEVGKGALSDERWLLPGNFEYQLQAGGVTFYEQEWEITEAGTYRLQSLPD